MEWTQPFNNYEKQFLFLMKSSFCSQDIPIFVFPYLGDSCEKSRRRSFRWFWDFLKEEKFSVPVFLVWGFFGFFKCNHNFSQY